MLKNIVLKRPIGGHGKQPCMIFVLSTCK